MIPPHTDDKFLGEKLVIKQPVEGFRSGSDAVLLAASIPEAAASVLDVGCGVGVAALCVAHRLKGASVVGLDCQEDVISLAKANADNNQMQDRVAFVFQDIQDPLEKLEPQSFDCVLSNPPYFEDSTKSPHAGRALARNLAFILEEWIQFCLKMVKPRGYAHFIYPSSSLPQFLRALGTGVGGVEIFPLWPSPSATVSKRVIIKVRKGVKSPGVLHRGMVLHQEDGHSHTPSARKILWDGTELDMETHND